MQDTRHLESDLKKNCTHVIASLGINCSMFANCLVFCDVRHVRSLVLGQNVMFGSFRMFGPVVM